MNYFLALLPAANIFTAQANGRVTGGDPVDYKKSKKNFKFFEKKFINKKCAYGPKMKPRQGFRQIF